MLLVSISSALAVEGMWEPAQIPDRAEDMRRLGFDGSAALLARLDQAPLAAVVNLGGCTASFVSGEGLLVTNHHCAVDYLVQAQQEGEDLVETGLIASSRTEERSAGPGARVLIAKALRDVTPELTRGLDSASDLDRALQIEQRGKALVTTCEKAPGVRCRVAAYDDGRRYELSTSTELRDVRLVFVPPDSVGNYGDEIDNWQWPRHAGDFAFLRAYVGPDGKPADYSDKNVPYRPPAALTVSTQGVGPGDFVLVAGYPGGTSRWQIAEEVRRTAEEELPQEIAELQWIEEQIVTLEKEDASLRPRLELARGWISNELFYDRGVAAGFARSALVEGARTREATLRAWIGQDPARAPYGAALDELTKVITRHAATRARDEAVDWLGRSDLVSTARLLVRQAANRAKPDGAREPGFQDRDRDDHLAGLAELSSTLEPKLERAVVTRYLQRLVELPADQQIPELTALVGGDVAGTVDRMFATTVLTDEGARVRFFDASSAQLASSTDGFLRLAVALSRYDQARHDAERADRGALSRLRPVYLAALRGAFPGDVYADANSTLRLSYGTIKGYRPRDGVTYAAQTSIAGIAAKAGAWPFDAPAPLLAAIADPTRRGPYVDAGLGTVPVDFVSDLDTTGGNSGSPTLDARGRLVGLLFDGNTEGIASDHVFDPVMNRSIHCDIRYVLWYLDAVAHADGLLHELGVQAAW